MIMGWFVGFGETFFWAVVVLGMLIFVHELGHYLVAKKLGIGVACFSIGFGRRLWGFQREETEYRISVIPLGGYVRLVGEDPEAAAEASEHPDKSFSLRPVSHRFAVVAAGPAFNVAFALLLSWILHIAGVPVPGTSIGFVVPDTPAASAGLLAGDRIVAIDDKPIKKWTELVEIVRKNADRRIRLLVERGNRKVEIPIVPTTKTKEGKKLPYGRIGVSLGGYMVTERAGPLEAAWRSLQQNYSIIRLTVVTIYGMIIRSVPADVGGPIRISVVAAEQAKRGYRHLLLFTILLSLNLAVLNLLPIPILDGGHLVFFTVEALRGKPLSIRFREISMQVGTALLIGLMIFATYKDSIYYLFQSGRDAGTSKTAPRGKRLPSKGPARSR